MTITIEKAIKYYTSKKGLQRLFKMTVEKYERYGDFKGTIRLDAPSLTEQEEISDFLGKNCTKLSRIEIRTKDVIKAHQSTIFEKIDFLYILEAIEQRKIIPKKELQKWKKDDQLKILNNAQKKFAHSLWCQKWLQAVITKDPRTRSLWNLYENRQIFLETIDALCTALEELEKNQGKVQHIAVFATKITCDPHAFDLSGNSLLAQPFYKALCILAELNEEERNNVFQPEYIYNLYLQFGLMRESLLNYIFCTGIIAFNSEGKTLPVWEAACRSNSIHMTPLYELNNIVSAKPYGEYSEIYIVENPSVFTSLLNNLKGYYPPLICTFGQLNLASIRLLKLLVSNGNILNYSGDFDPEGLIMAQKLLDHFPENVRLWGFNEFNYICNLNKKSKKIEPPIRLQQLNQIKHPNLTGLAVKLKDYQRIVFQEQILDQLIQDLQIRFS